MLEFTARRRLGCTGRNALETVTLMWQNNRGVQAALGFLSFREQYADFLLQSGVPSSESSEEDNNRIISEIKWSSVFVAASCQAGKDLTMFRNKGDDDRLRRGWIYAPSGLLRSTP